MHNEHEVMRSRTCVKCPAKGILAGLDAKKAAYCQQCFIAMVKHKFSSAIGKRRVYRDGNAKETLIIFEGTSASAFLLAMIVEGLKPSAHKKLTIDPTVMVLLSVRDRNEIECVVQKISEFRIVLPVRWFFIHYAAILSSSLESSFGEEVVGLKELDNWNYLLESCQSETIRVELMRIVRTNLCVRVAEYLRIGKVMFPDSADYLAKCALSTLALGRGCSIASLTAVVQRLMTASIIRPLRDISEKEICIVNKFQNSDQFLIILPDFCASEGRTKQSNNIQDLTADFITTLQLDGYCGTIPTVLGTASKLQSVTTGKQKCELCFSSYDPENELDRFCYGCNRVVSEIRSSAVLEELLPRLTTSFRGY
ncbi:hypothetical protein AB6A40_006245 [Gnathostoma spinigerum]|uniref:Cytoplasmic tRNA 2-thiolation protein 2 n=1 Tax=Gnathostoma spinigerum TaxID=75299 RepID=A0ABD6EIG8_9BILA